MCWRNRALRAFPFGTDALGAWSAQIRHFPAVENGRRRTAAGRLCALTVQYRALAACGLSVRTPTGLRPRNC
jgi:hypothetical protein